MSRTSKALLVALPLSLLVATGCSRIIAGRTTKPAGGVQVTLQAKPGALSSNNTARLNQLDNTVEVLVHRARSMPGVSGATAEIQGHDKIVVTLPGARNGRQAASMLTQSALMEFYYLRDVKTDRNPSAKWMMLDTETDPKTGTDVYSFEDSVTHQVIKGDTPASQKLILSKVIGAYDPIKNPNGMRPILTNKDLLPTAKADADMNGRAIVHIEFKPTGATVFRDFTRRHIGDIVAILIDGRILTAPRINEAIPGGQAEISGFKDLAQATDSAQRINLGAMSVHLNVVSVKNL